MKKITTYINNNRKILYILAFAIFSAITFEMFNRPFGDVTSLRIDFDDKIPLIKELIVVYHTFMPLLVYTGFILYKDNEKNYKKYVATLFLAQITAYIIYVFFQTTVPRYDTALLGNDIFSKILKLTYKVDNNYSAAPSLHVCQSFVASIFIYKSGMDKKRVIFLILYFMLVASTTVLVKQHVVLDIPAGILHSLVNFLIIEYIFKKRK